MADGMHLNGTRGDTQFVENEVSASERFGLLVNAARGTLFRNRGGENLYGIGLYGGSDLIGDLESIRGRDPVLPVRASQFSRRGAGAFSALRRPARPSARRGSPRTTLPSPRDAGPAPRLSPSPHA